VTPPLRYIKIRPSCTQQEVPTRAAPKHFAAAGVLARQPCYLSHFPPGFRPVALRPTLSDGLPFTSINFYLTAESRRQTQTFLLATDRHRLTLTCSINRRHTPTYADPFCRATPPASPCSHGGQACAAKNTSIAPRLLLFRYHQNFMLLINCVISK
jgi:hypothetical protein